MRFTWLNITTEPATDSAEAYAEAELADRDASELSALTARILAL